MENKMFCFQCQETAGCTGCTKFGVCGKSPDLARMQDLLIYTTKGLSEVTTRLREEGKEVIPVLGLPGGVMYSKRTIFDLVLPRLTVGEILTAEDLNTLGEGGLCLNCPECTFPNCGFGKGGTR